MTLNELQRKLNSAVGTVPASQVVMSSKTSEHESCLSRLEGSLQEEMNRRGVAYLPLSIVETRSKQYGGDDKLLRKFLSAACPALYTLSKDGSVWTMCSTDMKGDRIGKLKQRDPKKNKDYESVISRAIRETCLVVTNAKEDSPAKSQTTGLTVEDRVRARAMAKRKRLSEMKKSEKGTDNDEWAVRVADVLQSHSSAIVRRQLQFVKAKRCSMTLYDAVSLVRNHLDLSKRQVADQIAQIKRKIPEWISIDGDKKTWTKSSTVWLTPGTYASVRHKLVKDGTPPPMSTTPLLTETANGHNRLTKETQPKVATPQVSEEMAPAKMRKKKHAYSAPPKHVVKPKRTFEAPNKPRESKRRRTGLRINPNLILSDADHAGGEIIPLTTFDSPRGLKKLFDQMKEGQRI